MSNKKTFKERWNKASWSCRLGMITWLPILAVIYVILSPVIIVAWALESFSDFFESD